MKKNYLKTEINLMEKNKAVKKAREEYHSFMRVRELKDINSSYNLTSIMLRLEGNLASAVIDEKSARMALLK